MQTKKVVRKRKVSKTRKHGGGGRKAHKITIDLNKLDDASDKILQISHIKQDIILIITNKDIINAFSIVNAFYNLLHDLRDYELPLVEVIFDNVNDIGYVLTQLFYGYEKKVKFTFDYCTGDIVIIDVFAAEDLIFRNCTINNIKFKNVDHYPRVNENARNTNNKFDIGFLHNELRLEDCKAISPADNINIIFEDPASYFGRKILKELYISSNVVYRNVNGTEDVPFPENTSPYELTVYREGEKHRNKNLNNLNNTKKKLYKIEKEFPSDKKIADIRRSKEARRN
jgi:hypothetical protein